MYVTGKKAFENGGLRTWFQAAAGVPSGGPEVQPNGAKSTRIERIRTRRCVDQAGSGALILLRDLSHSSRTRFESHWPQRIGRMADRGIRGEWIMRFWIAALSVAAFLVSGT